LAPQLVIRAATLAEHEQLEALQRRASLALEAYRNDLLAHPEAIELPIEQIKQCRVLIAERDGKILGFVSVLPPSSGAAELDGLFVEPGRWRGGVGSRLVEAAVVWPLVKAQSSCMSLLAPRRAASMNPVALN
jgi:N-acetylglutamate synthase-like GNAT family acetyltransferase